MAATGDQFASDIFVLTAGSALSQVIVLLVMWFMGFLPNVLLHNAVHILAIGLAIFPAFLAYVKFKALLKSEDR